MSSLFRENIAPDDQVKVRALLESTGFFKPAEVEVALEILEESIAEQAAGQIDDFACHHLFLEIEDELIAYSCFGRIPRTLYSYDLYWIATASEQQGQGFGRQMLAEVEKIIVERFLGKQLYIETASKEQYEKTRRFYVNNGYEQAAYLPDFYDPGDALSIYVKYF